MSLLLRKGNDHRKVYCVVFAVRTMTSMIRWLDEMSKGSTRQCWSPDQICGSSHWSPAPISPSALPFNSLILLVIWSVSPTRHPSTNYLNSSEQWTKQASNLRKNWQNREGTSIIPNVTCWTVGKCVCVYVRKCVCVCVVCDVIGVREKLALCLAAGWWTLNSIAQRHILSNRTLHNVTLSRGASSAFIIQ